MRILAALLVALWTGGAVAQTVTTAPIGQVGLNKIVLPAVAAANTAASVPANGFIQQIVIVNTTANAITGGLKVGTTAGATDIAAAVAIAGNAIVTVTDAALLKRWFSTSSAQQIFIDAVAAWNSASVNITIVWGQL